MLFSFMHIDRETLSFSCFMVIVNALCLPLSGNIVLVSLYLLLLFIPVFFYQDIKKTKGSCVFKVGTKIIYINEKLEL